MQKERSVSRTRDEEGEPSSDREAKKARLHLAHLNFHKEMSKDELQAQLIAATEKHGAKKLRDIFKAHGAKEMFPPSQVSGQPTGETQPGGSGPSHNRTPSRKPKKNKGKEVPPQGGH